MASDQYSRRDVIRRVAQTGTVAALGSQVATGQAVFQTDYMYVWASGRLAQSSGARDSFLRMASSIGVADIFLSWGDFDKEGVSDRARAELIRACQQQGLRVHLTVGRRGPRAGSRAVLDSVPEMAEWAQANQSVDGLHLNAEPASGDASAVSRFLAEYKRGLNSGKKYGFPLSLTIGWWWGTKQNTRAALNLVRDHPMVDFVVVMAYADTEQAVRKRTRKAMTAKKRWVGENKWSYKPYVVAVEFGDTAKDFASFREEGLGALSRTVTGLRQRPPKPPQFVGTCFHHYMALR